MQIVAVNPRLRWSPADLNLFAESFVKFVFVNKLNILSDVEFVALCKIIAQKLDLPERVFTVNNIYPILQAQGLAIEVLQGKNWHRHLYWQDLTIDSESMAVTTKGIPGIFANVA